MGFGPGPGMGRAWAWFVPGSAVLRVWKLLVLGLLARRLAGSYHGLGGAVASLVDLLYWLNRGLTKGL